MTEPLLKLTNITTQFGSHVVHHQLNLTVYTGEILGLVGGSGSGKSVLLRTAIGLNKAASGTVELNTEQFGVLFQHGALFSSLTVAENVALPLLEHTNVPRRQVYELAQLKLALVGLDPSVGHRYPAELSGGMIKRAALARALIREPTMLFLDEPTAGLDPISAASFDELLLTLSRALDLTVILITHDLDTLHTICDRVAVLAQKKILAVDSLPAVAQTDDPWIQAYFHGPRGRSAQAQQTVIQQHSEVEK